jgi:hypothetical protein
MRRNSKVNPRESKRVARQRYGERKLNTWIKWRWKQFGVIRYKDLLKQCKDYNI